MHYVFAAACLFVAVGGVVGSGEYFRRDKEPSVPAFIAAIMLFCLVALGGVKLWVGP